MTAVQSAQLSDIASRIRILEDKHIRFETIIDLMKKIDNRVGLLENHDEEFMAIVHNSCTLKDKQIGTARDEAIKISTEYAKSNHDQTLKLMGGFFFLFISAVGFVATLSTSITESRTEIVGIKHSCDRMDANIIKILESRK